MPAEYNPDLEVFELKGIATPMIEAVKQLAIDSGQSIDQLDGRSFTYIGRLAEDTYDELPDFWRTWKDWHAPRPNADMGEL